jgi:3-oxoacyl-[acyl-carrier protein] reductase
VLTRVWAKELGARGITVNTLAPGRIDTDMNPWLRTEQGARTISEHAAPGRVGHADDIGDARAFLASPDSRGATAQRIEASGGLSL